MLKTIVPLSVIMLFVSISANALTDEEIKKMFAQKVLLCAKSDPHVDLAELLQLQQHKVPTNKQTKCVLACAYKAGGYMTEDGLYDLNSALSRAPVLASGDKKKEENFKKMANICSKVNDEKVSDGKEGCDRAALIFKCTVENAPKFGFVV